MQYLPRPDAGHVIIIDDDDAIRRSLYNLLTREGYMVCLHESADAFLSVRQLPTGQEHIGLQQLYVELQQELSARGFHMPIVVVSGDSRPDEIISAMKHGAVDFLLKPFGASALLEALKKAMKLANQTVIDKNREVQVKQRLTKLTPREQEVCYWMVRGYSNQQISLQDGAAAATIKLHRARVMEKMQAESLPELIAMLSGITLPEPKLKADEPPVQG